MARPTRDQHEKNVCYFWLVYEDWFWTVIMLNSEGSGTCKGSAAVATRIMVGLFQ
ncbi:unnamed protein product [Pylaiella littoralis]